MNHYFFDDDEQMALRQLEQETVPQALARIASRIGRYINMHVQDLVFHEAPHSVIRALSQQADDPRTQYTHLVARALLNGVAAYVSALQEEMDVRLHQLHKDDDLLQKLHEDDDDLRQAFDDILKHPDYSCLDVLDLWTRPTTELCKAMGRAAASGTA